MIYKFVHGAGVSDMQPVHMNPNNIVTLPSYISQFLLHSPTQAYLPSRNKIIYFLMLPTIHTKTKLLLGLRLVIPFEVWITCWLLENRLSLKDLFHL